jgi:hypothetical protein
MSTRFSLTAKGQRYLDQQAVSSALEWIAAPAPTLAELDEMDAWKARDIELDRLEKAS